ncbi:MAG: InlB B-repeat-containing protein, partial [Alphaproteobacteria bacterium]|nr:InlB B-repeat-containing protein [Alphaproteobacteria bacterium]
AYDDKVDENNINYYNEGFEPCLTTYVCDDHYSGPTCEPETYNVTYYDGENIIGALAENYGTYTFGEGLTLPTGQDIKDYYQKLHYTFVGWYDNAEFEGDVIQEISAEDYGNKVFYSKWEPTVYHIEFSYGKAGNRTTGFTGNTDTQNVNFGDKNIPLNSNGFAIAGYEFDYWTCSATYDNGETYTGNYQNNAEITEYVYNSDMLCEAHWMANSYSLSYNCGNGGELADGQSETVSVDYDAEYVLNNSVCKVRPNYTLINWTCSNDLDLTQSVWNITDNSTCTAHWEETRYVITYLNTDGTQFNSLSPTTYLSSATPLTVPTTNPANTEHADFVGWCDDASLTQNCALTREIPSGSSGDITFYAKWVASACPAGQYLDSASASCLNCESGYTSAAWSATKPEDCYYDWNCEYSCPDNAESCSLVSGVSNGRIYYGSNETYSCDINVVCKDGYTFDASSNQCGANHYNITYHLNNGVWASATDVHPNSYTVGTSSISISQPSRDWHSFDGWCVGEDDCNNPVKNFVINPAETIGDIELFAQWSFTSCQTGYTPENTANGKICVPQYYNITYMDGNVELEHLATRFTIEDTTIQLASISNPGYIFDGWCVNTSSCTPSNMVKGILQGPWTVGDKTLYAQWTKEEFVCDSGKYLHIGNDAACLYTQKPSSPAFAVGKDNKKYYLKMTKKTEHPDGLPMNEESNKQINVLYDDELYNVHDASVNDAPVEFFEQ